MSPLAAPSPPLGTLAATHGSDRARLSVAAKQFEAIFVRQMLSAARAAKLGDDAFGGSGVDIFREMQDARFADIAAESGALGLAKTIEAQLAALLGGSARASTSSARTDPGNHPDPAQPELVEARPELRRRGRAPTSDRGA